MGNASTSGALDHAVAALVNAKRGISKAQAKKLAEYFGVSVELFI